MRQNQRDLSGYQEPAGRTVCQRCGYDLWTRQERFGHYDYIKGTIIAPRAGKPPALYVIGDHEVLCQHCWTKWLKTAPESFRAIWQESQSVGWPTAYRCDITKIDRRLILEELPIRFIWGLRPYGTHLFPIDNPRWWIDREIFMAALSRAETTEQKTRFLRESWIKARRNIRASVETICETDPDTRWYIYDKYKSADKPLRHVLTMAYTAWEDIAGWVDEIIDLKLTMPDIQAALAAY